MINDRRLTLLAAGICAVLVMAVARLAFDSIEDTKEQLVQLQREHSEFVRTALTLQRQTLARSDNSNLFKLLSIHMDAAGQNSELESRRAASLSRDLNTEAIKQDAFREEILRRIGAPAQR